MLTDFSGVFPEEMGLSTQLSTDGNILRSLKILSLLQSNNIDYRHLHHRECRTSSESAKARAESGGEFVLGAKAILMKVEGKITGTQFQVFVLPGERQINSKTLKKSLKQQFSDVHRFRFATPQEMALQTGGLVPGTMPPFAQPIFEKLTHLSLRSKSEV
ncbi:YbaK/EbsC family protein [Crocosphaera sp. XPORK-15E]|uniref:YbaK/EbsC family protein n=1 Tax=Crocosphaera sp. XPORK-15E TaxID=3110247 RepID=UPI002B2094B4|nr:YbaK/EbsC family protein [Crocosphaera sp. XPORK-15E]MEA5537329.1 YbaK/EbsC family protein [Crocosphaera sp. XPORK-15E]